MKQRSRSSTGRAPDTKSGDGGSNPFDCFNAINKLDQLDKELLGISLRMNAIAHELMPIRQQTSAGPELMLACLTLETARARLVNAEDWIRDLQTRKALNENR